MIRAIGYLGAALAIWGVGFLQPPASLAAGSVGVLLVVVSLLLRKDTYPAVGIGDVSVTRPTKEDDAGGGDGHTP